MPMEQLLSIAKSIKFRLTDDDIDFIKNLTVDQSKSWHWEKLRVGRVTGSTFKKVCKGNFAKPAKSTIMKICYPEKIRFNTAATQYGKDWEDYAKIQFDSIMSSEHENYHSQRCGLLVSKLCNFFAFSPDAVCDCSCCGKFLVEIKCPFSIKDPESTIEDLLSISDPYILLENNEYVLNRKHDYYFQIQMGMGIYGCEFGYFYVWSPKLMVLDKVKFNQQLWDENNVLAYRYVKSVIIPEMMNGYYTKTY